MVNSGPDSASPAAPGLLWVAYGFVGVLAMNRAFAREQEQGALDGLLAAPVSRDAVFLGKMLSTLTFMLVIEVVLLPVFAVMLDLPTLSVTLGLIILLALRLSRGTKPVGEKSGEVGYPTDAVAWQEQTNQLPEIQPAVGRSPQSEVVQVQTVNVDVGANGVHTIKG